MTYFASTQPGLIDQATAAAMPLVAMPIDGIFEALPRAGRRLIAAKDGMYLEARSPALYVRLRISDHTLPYGNVSSEVILPGGPIPRAFARHMKDLALTAHPEEMAALVIADSNSPGGYRLHKPDSEASFASVSYQDTGYDENLLVIDAHSHGYHEATFSHTDDDSDRSRIGPHISLVFGRCADRQGCEIAARICVGRYLVPITLAALETLFV